MMYPHFFKKILFLRRRYAVLVTALGLVDELGHQMRDEISNGIEQESSKAIPDELICPLTLSTFQDPMVCADGHTYERVAITDRLRYNLTSPTTNLPLEHLHVAANHQVCQLAEASKFWHAPGDELKRRYTELQKALGLLSTHHRRHAQTHAHVELIQTRTRIATSAAPIWAPVLQLNPAPTQPSCKQAKAHAAWRA